MNFIYTTCTTICPPLGATFGKLQRSLGERTGKDVFLISVSVDPPLTRRSGWRLGSAVRRKTGLDAGDGREDRVEPAVTRAGSRRGFAGKPFAHGIDRE